VVRRGEADGGTVEVAHEALFREWKRLQGWLEPERARLDALRSLQVDAAAWDRNGRAAAFLNHRDKRLAETAALAGIEGYRKRMAAVDTDYLAACQAAERSARSRARRVQALVYALFIGIIGGLVAWINQATLQEEWRLNWTERRFAAANFRVIGAERERALEAEAAACVANAAPERCTFRECTAMEETDYCLEMIVVPAGSFMMGSPATEKNHSTGEGPLHAVMITKPFAVAKYTVTFDEWDTCVAYGDCPPADVVGGRFGPATNVSWDDAQGYVAWLNRMTGQRYRLLSEAEYEYATRAGTQTAYPWGDNIKLNGKAMANCNGCGSEWDNRRTAPVGMFAPNGFGLYDMVGNIYSWVEDCHHDDYDGAPTDGSAWIKGGDCKNRVVRGGSWNDSSDNLRSAARDQHSVRIRDYSLSFRVARTLLAP
jgi:formylglycine-generating enzyme required for sulfatase activity